jgi:antitoxin (DNA-binding transcriptional repressor) of toxin-antitoxin stability system
MSETIITVTEAARNFADCVNRAHYRNETFVLLKNGVPFARLVPEGERVCCSGKQLAAALSGVALGSAEARAWSRDLKAARGAMIGFYDVIVAATALERNWPVASFNVRHFRTVDGLKVIEPGS